MEDKYRAIYNELFNNYQRRRLFNPYYYFEDINLNYDLRGLMYKVIKQFENENIGFELRSDAKLFLVTTFDNLVIAPVLKSIDQENNNISFEELEEYIEEDIKLILRESLIELERNGNFEISSHTVIRTLVKVWDRVKSSAANLWG
jgi:hypothetical protein